MRREKNKYIFAPDKKHRRKTHRFRNTVLLLLAVLVFGFLITNFVISNHVVLEKKNITVLNLQKDLESYSILHISDLHGAQLGDHQQAIGTALGNLRYSCVIMTGDMLGPDGDTSAVMDLIRLIPEETPKYYIPGDMDGSWLDTYAHGTLSVFTDWAEELRQAGVILLDRPVAETRKKATIWFVPEEVYTLNLDAMEEVFLGQLEDLNMKATTLTADEAAYRRVVEYELERVRDIRDLKDKFTAEDMQVVVSHEPLTADYIYEQFNLSGKEDYFSMRYAGLILAGHYNGGQWRLPFKGAIRVPELGWWPEDRLVQGLSFLEGIPQHISPGLGSDPHYEYQPGRVYNPPALTLITLTRKAS